MKSRARTTTPIDDKTDCSDWMQSTLLAVQAWTLVVNRLERGDRLVAMLFETRDTLLSLPAGTVERNWYWAIHWQLLKFTGGKIISYSYPSSCSWVLISLFPRDFAIVG